MGRDWLTGGPGWGRERGRRGPRLAKKLSRCWERLCMVGISSPFKAYYHMYNVCIYIIHTPFLKDRDTTLRSAASDAKNIGWERDSASAEVASFSKLDWPNEDQRFARHDFLKNFLYWCFLQFYNYIIENWVWLGFDLVAAGTFCCCSLHSSQEFDLFGWPSTSMLAFMRTQKFFPRW